MTMTTDSTVVDSGVETAMENDTPLQTDPSLGGTPRLLITKMVRKEIVLLLYSSLVTRRSICCT
jgi:hypothetical protein